MQNIKQLDAHELRKFGLVTGTIFTILFGLLFPWIFGTTIPIWPWVLSATLIIWALIHPSSLSSVYNLWMKIGHVLGWVNTRIILVLIFYMLFFPIAIILKILGKDPLQKKLDRELSSYRIKSPPQPREHIERLF
jgi:Kef-type K+ transport system membrane component KefB